MLGLLPRRRFLIFAEDPGAAIYLQHFPGMLRSADTACDVLATGHALEFWDQKGLAPDRHSPGVSAALVLDAYQPSLVIVGTSENSESFSFELTDAARARGIATVGVVDGAANAADRFRGVGDDPLSFAPDWLIVPDEATGGAFGRLGFPPARIRACGHPQFDEVGELRSRWSDEDRRAMREKWLLAPDPGRLVLMFVSELSTGLNPHQYRRSPAYTLSGNPENEGRTEIVLDELLMAVSELPEKPYLVLRLHPKQGVDDLPRHRPLFDQVSHCEPALEMVHAADAVVGMTSMLLAESALLGRPTLSLVPRVEEHAWLGELASSIPCVWTRDKLRDKLPRMLEARSGDGTAPGACSSRDSIINFFRENFA